MDSIWRNPIFDRTQHDVAFAIRQIEAWKQSHRHTADVQLATEEIILNGLGDASVARDELIVQDTARTVIENETLVLELGVVYDLKGCFNLSDITRIEDNIAYISEILTKYRYSIESTSKKWTSDSLPTEQDMKRIRNNIRSIFSGFITPSEASALPDVMLSYADINALEYNLYLLKQLLDVMESSFIKSGTYKCGAINRLPIRR